MVTNRNDLLEHHYQSRLGTLEYLATYMVKYQQQYQKQIDENIHHVTIDVQKLMEENEELRSILQNITSHGATEEDGVMNDILASIKNKTDSMDGTVRKIETDLAVLNKTVELKLEAIQSNIDLKFSTVQTALNDIKSSIKEMKTDNITNKKYWITTTITGIALLVAIAVGVGTWINALK